MKYLIVFLLFLTACGPSDFRKLVGIRKFSVGDCLVISIHDPEKWDKPEYSVLEIGRSGYLIKRLQYGYTETVSYGHFWEDFYQKVPCPKDYK